MKQILRAIFLLIGLIWLTFPASCVSAKTLTITTNTLPEGTASQSYSQTLKVHGGAPPYIWSIIGGELPIGLQLNPETGVISGTPLIALSAAFVTFQVTDNSKKIAIKQILMAVNPTTTTTSTFSTITTSTTINSASVNSISGLSLSLSLDSITYNPGQDVYITVENTIH